MHTPLPPLSLARRAVDGFGQFLLTLGLVSALFVAYEVWGKAAAVTAHQRDLDLTLSQQWVGEEPRMPRRTVMPTEPAPQPKLGRAVAKLSIPSLHGRWVV